MRISFVIPAYNEENYLPACIESILKQTAALSEPAQIIVVNNASSDGTRAVAMRYPEVTLVDEPRKGLTFARQAGFSACTGELIANVDADSRLTPAWVDKVLTSFAQDDHLVCVSGPLIYYDLAPMQKVSVQLFYLLAFAIYILNRYVLRAGSMVQGGNFVVKAEALRSIGGFDTNISFYGEDTDIARRMNSLGNVRFTFALKMFSSARRLKNEGMFTIGVRYTMNYFWTTFRKKPFTKTYVDHRATP